ncbi:MAG: insulinase family protein [Betaproteobacteria bacterium]|nr:MAG: insulinase family protein [Betaproteobacteria bacterium]
MKSFISVVAIRSFLQWTALCLCALVLPLTSSMAQSTPAGFEIGPSVEGITEYRLKSNGLRVLLFAEPSNPKITVNVTYLVGSRHEGYGETGMAHLLEHMLFKSTPKFPNLWQDMSNRGFINNGTTWLDRTNYYETFAANDDNLRWALEMEAERMVNSNILRSELDTEMTVVRNEFEAGENRPQWTLYAKVFSSAFAWHNYGNNTIGNRSDIENVGIDNLRAFYRNYYQPDNAVLLVTGKIDTAKTLAWIEQYFGAIPKPTRQLPKLWTVEPTQDGEREVTVRRVGDSQFLFAAYRVPAATHADSPALQVLAQLMTNDPAGRLYQSLVKSKLAVSVDNESDVMFEPSLMGFWANLNKTQSIDKARDVMLSAIENASQKPFSAEELARVKIQMEKSYDQTFADSGRFAVALSEAIAVGDWRFFFLQRDRVAKVTLADVERVAKAYFKPQNRTLGKFIPVDKPDRAEMPTTPAVADLLKNYQSAQSQAAGEVFDPTPANIEQRVERFKLANGMKVVLLPKKTRGNTVQIALRNGYGNLATRKGKAEIDELASALLMRGAKGLNRQQIRDRIDALRASGGVGLGGGAFQTRRAHVPELLELMAHIYATAALPADELEIVRKEIVTGIEESLKDPEALAFNAAARHFSTYPKGDPRYVASMAERVAALKAVKRDDIVRWVAQMRGFSDSEIAIVGDFDAPAVKAALNKHFAGPKLSTPFQRIVSEHKPIAAKSEKILTPDKENTTFVARVGFQMRDSVPDYAAIVLADFIVGGSAGARLFNRVREKEGLSYDVFSSLSVPTFSDNATWSFGFIANPQNAAKAEASLRDELKQLREGALTEQEFVAQRQSLLDQRAVRRAQDATLAQQLVNFEDTGRTFAFTQALEDNIRKLTKADFDAVMKKYVDLSAMSSFLAGDFSKVK